jgi:hypothetical protein
LELRICRGWRSGGKTPLYCPEQWRLPYGLGLEASNQPVLDAGTRHHARLAAAERLGAWAIRLGKILVLPALAALLL